MRIGVVVPIAVTPDTGRLPDWAELRAFAQHAESIGVRSLWVFDHFYDLTDRTPTGPIHEAWTLQSALAAVTSTVELGQLVMCSSFRHPALLAKMAVTADAVSGSRLTLGIGAGWYDREYQDLGLPTDHRASRFAEALDIVLPLLRGESVTVHGRYHRVENATLVPPSARRIPVLMAGNGPRMMALIARHADAWNTAWFNAVDGRLTSRIGAMRSALDEAGRPYESLRWTVGMSAPAVGGSAYADAVASFGDLAVDDLIVSTESASPTSLDLLADAASSWL
jgi:alkanesulfonate monooxygenase SsuD/methylene tetrahydromethanopterin reductase-like flavin-dependent oxidoreductase (luciferase family)